MTVFKTNPDMERLAESLWEKAMADARSTWLRRLDINLIEWHKRFGMELPAGVSADNA